MDVDICKIKERFLLQSWMNSLGQLSDGSYRLLQSQIEEVEVGGRPDSEDRAEGGT